MQEEINRTVGESPTAEPEKSAVLESKRRGGAGRGQGRKKSIRPLKKVVVNIYEDQHPISDSKIRAAIDLFNNSHSG
ncbi:MAG: hypothetical protein ACRC1D_03600 [Culicoidibacterales bacterium]